MSAQTKRLHCFGHARKSRGHQCGEPYEANVLSNGGLDYYLGRNVFPEIDHSIPVVFQDDANDVFPDVVDIAAHRGKQDFSFAYRIGAAGSDPALDDLKALTGSVGGVDELREEKSLALVFLSDTIKGGDEQFVDDFKLGTTRCRG